MEVKPINNSKMTACNFFAGIVTTPGLPAKAVKKSAEYLDKIIESMEKDVTDLLASTSSVALIQK